MKETLPTTCFISQFFPLTHLQPLIIYNNYSANTLYMNGECYKQFAKDAFIRGLLIDYLVNSDCRIRSVVRENI